MLILTRKTGQSFTIGDNITISVVETLGDKVRIGIEAPRDVRVLREELLQTMNSNQQASQGVSSEALRAAAASLRKKGQ